MARRFECRVCGVRGTFLCEACTILVDAAKAQGCSLRKYGILDQRTSAAIHQREVALDERML